MALVSKRFRALCVAPQLLRSVEVITSAVQDGEELLPRVASALRFLTAHAAHVHQLGLHVDGRGSGGHQTLFGSPARQVEADVAGCLAACATAGCSPT